MIITQPQQQFTNRTKLLYENADNLQNKLNLNETLTASPSSAFPSPFNYLNQKNQTSTPSSECNNLHCGLLNNNPNKFINPLTTNRFSNLSQQQQQLAQNFRNQQSAITLNSSNNFVINNKPNESNQIYIETGYVDCPFHSIRTEW